MLKRLTISNLAIIENAEIAFAPGFTVLTGATGAGKSLLIDSLSLLLGARSSSELIRQGEEKASVIGVFEVTSKRLRGVLDSLEIPVLDNELTIERILSKGKSTVKANGVTLSLSSLNTLSRVLADIHNQFDFAKIVTPENYLPLVDGFAFEAIRPYQERFDNAYGAYLSLKKEYEELLAEKQQIEARRDFYAFQLDELNKANLVEGEEESLEQELSLLKNYDKVYSLSQEASQIVHEDFLDRLYELQKTLGKLALYQSQYQEIQQTLEDRYYELDDLLNTLKKDLGDLDYDPSRLDELMQRESDLAILKRKYQKDLAGLIAYREELKGFLDQNKYGEEALLEKQQAVEQAKNHAIQLARDLSTVRQKAAKTITQEMDASLKDLLLHASFAIEFREVELSPTGIDEVDFLIETNVGEGMKHLEKVVSGGEASRIMLALKSIYIKANKIATVVFDEIDTGISGEVAEAVARKIAEIALSSQVIAITHLPQVASLSDHHILVTKSVRNGRTFASVKELDLEGKIEEVAHLISGEKLTKAQLDYAREMVLSKGK
ncbi:MAG: DNA repair protein RecN [Bacilli bacterium]|nr:DNA repair protein RecN [Bacilli bacterium]